jgi:DNA-binding CsgD family transcriptional regulator
MTDLVDTAVASHAPLLDVASGRREERPARQPEPRRAQPADGDGTPRPCPWIEAFREPALVLGERLEVVDANAAYHSDAAYAAALHTVPGRLPSRGAFAGRLAAVVAATAAEGREHVLTCAGPVGLLELRLTPVPGLQGAGALVVVTLHDAAVARRVCVQRLRALYGLTRMQAEVASRLVETLDAAAVSAALGVSTNTVRSHLRIVNRKVGAGSQLDLVQRLALGAARAPHRK